MNVWLLFGLGVLYVVNDAFWYWMRKRLNRKHAAELREIYGIRRGKRSEP